MLQLQLMSLERLRSHPARYLVPNALTVARPILGWKALQAARHGDWATAKKYLYSAMVTDMEGNVARQLNATSNAGAIADPFADGVLRVEGLLALMPELHPITSTVMIGGELINLALNAQVQKGRETPVVPKGAKVGSFTQAAGAALVIEGATRNKPALKAVGEAAVVAGTVLRVGTYYSLYRKDRQGLPWYAKHPRHARNQS